MRLLGPGKCRLVRDADDAYYDSSLLFLVCSALIRSRSDVANLEFNCFCVATYWRFSFAICLSYYPSGNMVFWYRCLKSRLAKIAVSASSCFRQKKLHRIHVPISIRLAARCGASMFSSVGVLASEIVDNARMWSVHDGADLVRFSKFGEVRRYRYSGQEGSFHLHRLPFLTWISPKQHTSC